MAQLSDYLAKIPSEHQNSPNFIAFISIFLQGHVDNQNVLAQVPSLFNLDTAYGIWLDFIGARVGQSRQIDIPLPDVYFSWDTEGVGWDQGTWFALGDATEGLVVLPDDSYRQLLRAVIAANMWDGTIPGAYAVWDIAFGSNMVGIRDNQNRTIDIIWMGELPDAVTLALLKNGKLNLVPAGVRVSGYYQLTNPNEGYAGGLTAL